MLHSFYTEIEKILKRIAEEIDQQAPSTEFWHGDLLEQMQQATDSRAAVISRDLGERLKEYLAFRHLFRGASVALMRWAKMKPLAEQAEQVFNQFDAELTTFFRGETKPYK